MHIKTFLRSRRLFRQPNGPELSCGDVQLVECSSLRGRSHVTIKICSASRGAKAGRTFRQLERLVRTHAVEYCVFIIFAILRFQPKSESCCTHPPNSNRKSEPNLTKCNLDPTTVYLCCSSYTCYRSLGTSLSPLSLLRSR